MTPELNGTSISNEKVLVLSDNELMVRVVEGIVNDIPEAKDISFDFGCSPGSRIAGIEVGGGLLRDFNLKTQLEEIIDQDYLFILSAHCKQIFPKELVEKVNCINIHPGFNPYNRGMFPHIFSIVNGLPAGATLHVMDNEIDHGPIIDQEEVTIARSDTSESLYGRIIEVEKNILQRNMGRLILGNYTSHPPQEPGNINKMKDFDKLREISLLNEGTFENHLNLLRALSHGDNKNAYFIDPVNGERVWVRVVLEEE